ncbi:MAG TPA: MFS transporter [Thermomicrobiales bacterium]|nr:MFS transporter [Thermomicrobiales bacterium]
MTGAPGALDVDDIAARRERWIVWIVSACVFVSVVNTSMVNVALPTIGDHFNADEARVGWIVTIYALAFGVGTPFYGRLGDRYGLRRMFVIGLCVFVVASVLAGVAAGFGFLLACRALQAAGSAAIPSLGTAMIARAVPFERRGWALGLTSVAVGAGSALGPTLGGVLTQFASWRMVFLISALLGLLVPLTVRYLPEGPGSRRDGIDWFGGVTLGMTIAGIMLAVAGAQRQGPSSSFVLISVSVAILGAALTVWRQRVAPQPFVDHILVQNRRYLLLCAIGFCTMAGNIGALVITPFLFRDINGLSAGQIGLAMLPAAVAVAILSRPVGSLADRIDPFLLVIAGLVVTLAALSVMALVGIGWPVAAFALLAMFVGVGQALISAPLAVMLTRSVPQRAYGVGLGVFNMMFFVGSGFGAALSTATLAARRGAEQPLLPVYAGSAQFIEFSDAFIPCIALFALALALTLFARRAKPVAE